MRAIFLLTAAALTLGTPPVAMAQTAAPKRLAGAAASAAVARLSPDVVEQLVRVGAESDGTYDFLGIHRFDGDTSLLAIGSARQHILFAASQASAKGGRYNPPQDMRLDVVTLSCGDEDLGERWDCARISVRNAKGARVAPVLYDASPTVYRNALGGSWTAFGVIATVRMSDVKDGFSVLFAGKDGTEFVEEVPAAKVNQMLFGTLPLTKAMRTAALEEEKRAIAAEPDPPDVFAVEISRVADGWSVVATNADYTWHKCSLVVQGRQADIGDLPPSKVVQLSVRSFTSGAPSLDAKAFVRCTAKGRVVQGPLPAELSISVQSTGPASWVVRNLTDWRWSNCVAEHGASRAKLSYFVPNTSAMFGPKDFSPELPSDARPEDLTFACAPNGRQVVGVRK